MVQEDFAGYLRRFMAARTALQALSTSGIIGPPAPAGSQDLRVSGPVSPLTLYGRPIPVSPMADVTWNAGLPMSGGAMMPNPLAPSPGLTPGQQALIRDIAFAQTSGVGIGQPGSPSPPPPPRRRMV